MQCQRLAGAVLMKTTRKTCTENLLYKYFSSVAAAIQLVSICDLADLSIFPFLWSKPSWVSTSFYNYKYLEMYRQNFIPILTQQLSLISLQLTQQSACWSLNPLGECFFQRNFSIALHFQLESGTPYFHCSHSKLSITAYGYMPCSLSAQMYTSRGNTVYSAPVSHNLLVFELWVLSGLNLISRFHFNLPNHVN